MVIAKAQRHGVVRRIHHGAYCLVGVWEPADRAARHRLRSHVVRRLYGDAVARSHVSALLELGGPDWGLDLSTVHLTSLLGAGERIQAGIAHHRGVTMVDDITRRDGSWLTAPARTALDTAAGASRDPAVAVLDWVQATGNATRDELDLGVERMQMWPGTIGLHHKLRLSNGRAESVLETRAHLLCRDHDLPMFEPQFAVFHPSGRLAGRVDGAWPAYRTMIELDGMTKYLRHRRAGETIEECVLREKQRENLLRRLTGWTMIRLAWSDLERPVETARMLRAHLLAQTAA
ncbi:MAG: hypothetical protein JWN84_4156 [Nocardioides sp.]|nr:hypothetical protein [Nocardioides sp.]